MQHAMKEAAEMGMYIRVPRNDELFIDLDTEEQYDSFKARYKLLVEHRPMSFVEQPSKTGLPHRHVVVSLSRPVADEHERIYLQLLLGSDGRREMRSYLSMITGRNSMPTLFFEQMPSEPVAYIDRDNDAY